MEDSRVNALTLAEADSADDVTLAVVMLESARAVDHAMTVDLESEVPELLVGAIQTMVVSAVVWARRRGHPGATLGEALANARVWVDDHPGDLARHDQLFAEWSAANRSGE